MAIQTETDLGKVAIMPKGEWVIGVLYEILDMVTHNGNLYLSLKDTSVEPTDDGVNWMLLMEGVPIATDTVLGKVKPDGKTITIENGTLHGASQVPEGVTYVDLEAETQELQAKLPVDADTLEGHAAEYFATKKDLENIDVSGSSGVTFPLEVPNSKEIKFIGLENPDSSYSKLLSHILYKDKNALVLKSVDEKDKEKKLIRIYEDDYGNSIVYFESYLVDMTSIASLKIENIALIDTNEDEVTVRAIATDNGSGLEICKDGSVYETLLEIDGNGISNFSHSVNVLSGNLGLDSSNAQQIRFKNFWLGQNSTDSQFWLFNNTDPIFNYNSNLGYSEWYKKIVLNKGIEIDSDNPDYAALMEVNDCNFMLKGSTGSSFYPFMSVDIDSNEMTVYGDLVLNEGHSLYIGSHIALSVYNFTSKIPTINFAEAISILTDIDTARSGIYFSDNFQKPAWQIVQSQHVTQGEWFLDFYYNDAKNNRNRLIYIGQDEMRVGIPLVAPNVSKMAFDIVTAQQEITEQDLQLIETQQLLTEQELENIETQQMLTEMDLEKIEGGQGL